MMRVEQKVAVGIVALYSACILAIFGLIFLPSSPGPARTDTSTSVKVVAGSGHGSGVHIGNGYILTAAHVILDEAPNPRLEAEIKIKTVAGEKLDPEVLWFNRDYDLALLRAGIGSFPSASLTCRAPKVGDKIVAIGNPHRLEFITTWGMVGGTARQVERWRSVFMFNGALLPGMSGGPALYDDTKELAGIMVAVIGDTSMGLVVPADVACHLMGRT